MQIKQSITKLSMINRKLLFAPGLILLCYFPVRPQSTNSLKDSIDILLSSWKNDQAPGISIAAVKDGKVLYNRSFGMANIKNKEASNSVTNYWIASVSKQFTAAAIYLLASEKKLELNRSIRHYLPELSSLFQKVTIDHLIHHTSGIRDGFVLTALSKKTESKYTNENVLKYLKAQEKLNFAPGTRYEYNNSGYVLLAVVIEKVTGKSYPEYLKAHIFRPLEMKDTYVAGSFPNQKNQAEGYHSVSPNVYAEGHFQGNSYGSTGIVTTIDDLIRWSLFMQNPDLVPSLSAIHKYLLKAGKLSGGKTISYAGGLEKFIYNGLSVYEHFGTDEGFKANILYFPDSHLSVIGLTNNGSYYDLQRILYKISDLVHGKTNNSPYNPGSFDTVLQSENYYYNSLVPQFLKIQNFETYIKAGYTLNGYAAPYQIINDTLQSLDPIPNLFVRKNGLIQIIDAYYHNTIPLEQIQPVKEKDDLSTLSGEYFSTELQTSYKITTTESGLQFEFVPGLTFELFRITLTDFLFDYAGPNFLQFTKDGFEFSREGCRKLRFRKIK